MNGYDCRTWLLLRQTDRSLRGMHEKNADMSREYEKNRTGDNLIYMIRCNAGHYMLAAHAKKCMFDTYTEHRRNSK